MITNTLAEFCGSTNSPFDLLNDETNAYVQWLETSALKFNKYTSKYARASKHAATAGNRCCIPDEVEQGKRTRVSFLTKYSTRFRYAIFTIVCVLPDASY